MAAFVENSIIVEASLPFVWRVANDVERWPQLFTEYESVEVLERDAVGVTFRLTTVPNESGERYSWVSRRESDIASNSVRARRISEDGPFDQMVLLWRYESLDFDRTIMTWRQDFVVSPEAPFSELDAVAFLNQGTREQMRSVAQGIEQLRREPINWDQGHKSPVFGDCLTMLITPPSRGSSTSASGLLRLDPGQGIPRHKHDFSEEHLLVTSGTATITLGEESFEVGEGAGVLVPRGVAHAVMATDETCHLALFMAPLAPRPDLGHEVL
ncbi:SRPBCC family protein [Cutibacterium avidum]|uniref:SRPBCC family protein n=2 Tax=Actinomycetota TaxID=201174 RepID=UPI002902B21F|nr:SRPBCC family protein [Actinomyces sp.]MDU1430848.1 cupin domain-containing protein [Actinomyces sp.]MDU5516575.1 cupin domain-containing protein [Cutibacterium avidum]